jgi:hypothetical protein
MTRARSFHAWATSPANWRAPSGPTSLTHGLADAEPVGQDHHAWPRATAAGALQIAGHPAPGRAGAYARTGQATGVTRLCTCVPTGCGVRTR